MAKFKLNQPKSNRFRTVALPLLAIAFLLPSYSCNSSANNSPPSAIAPPNPNTAAQSEAPKAIVPPVAAEPEPATEIEPVSPASPASEEAIASDEIAQRLTVAGIDNPQAVKDFIAQMNTAATSNDADAIANLIHYPFTTYNLGEPLKTYTTPAKLLADFDQVVTPTALAAMSKANYDDLFANYQGVMIGDGAVWFGQFEEGLRIQAINR